MLESSYYDFHDLTREYGFTPSIMGLLGGTNQMDTYTPMAYARYSLNQYQGYLTKDLGRDWSQAELIDYLYRVADRFGIDRGIAYRQINRESGFNPTPPPGSSGEIGIAQFLPSTAAAYGLSAEDLKDPVKSLNAYGRHMRDLIDRFGGDQAKAVAAYNTGEPNVLASISSRGSRWLSGLARSTQAYVAAIVGGDPGQGNAGIFRDPSIPTQPGSIDDAMGVDRSQVPKSLGELFGTSFEDSFKRIGLVLLAIVLIAVAVISLR